MRSIKFWARYRARGLQAFTEGLARWGQKELMPHAEYFLKCVVKYIETEKQKITAHKTMNFGYWLVKFEPTDDGRLDVWEFDPEFQEFLHGGSLALR